MGRNTNVGIFRLMASLSFKYLRYLLTFLLVKSCNSMTMNLNAAPTVLRQLMFTL